MQTYKLATYRKDRNYWRGFMPGSMQIRRDDFSFCSTKPTASSNWIPKKTFLVPPASKA
jgi:hypothetical protein